MKNLPRLLGVAGMWMAVLGTPLALAVEALKLAPGERIVIDGRIDEAAWSRAPARQILGAFPAG